jgi:hypothetical protein
MTPDTLENERQEMIRAETEEVKDPFIPAVEADPTPPEQVLVRVVL